jgi:O-antigen/teichoic acid export membrane protein
MMDKVLKNVLYSSAEKAVLLGGQLLSVIIVVRNLSREEYGIIGIVSSYFAVLNLFNITFENAILRDHKWNSASMERFVNNFFRLAAIKAGAFLALACLLSVYFMVVFKKPEFIYGVASAVTIVIMDMLVAPALILASIRFDQKIVAKMTLIRIGANLTLLSGLMAFPSLKYLAAKDLVVGALYVGIWGFTAKNRFGLSIFPNGRGDEIDFPYLKRIWKDYLAWMHLSGVVTGLIAKADLFFLAFFVDLKSVGEYNLALSAANIGSLPPQILAYQHGVALSHADNAQSGRALTYKFIALSGLVCGLIFISFLVLGKFYLRLISGYSSPAVNRYMILIVGGLLIARSVIGPVISYINMRGSTKSLFMEVMLPVAIVSASMYLVSAYLYGSQGTAIANVIAAIAWVVMLSWHAVKRYPEIFNPFRMPSSSGNGGQPNLKVR